MAVDILEKVKKTGAKILNGSADAPILYFTDHEALEAWNRDMAPIPETGNVFLRTYREITGFTIDTIAELLAFKKDPEGFYKAQFIKANEEEYKRLTKLKLDFAAIIHLPENFNEVLKDLNKFNRYLDKKSPDYFTIENGSFELTEKAVKWRNQKVYHYATTQEEKDRLKICYDVIESFERLAPTLKNEKGLQQAVTEKLYFNPLPYILKRINTKDGVQIIPNPSFIKDCWAGSSHLGRLLPSAAEKKALLRERMPKLGEPWVKFNRKMVGGAVKLYTCLESEYPKVKNEVADELLPGTYNELGEPYGTRIDLTKSRAVSETSYSPFSFNK